MNSKTIISQLKSKTITTSIFTENCKSAQSCNANSLTQNISQHSDQGSPINRFSYNVWHEQSITTSVRKRVEVFCWELSNIFQFHNINLSIY